MPEEINDITLRCPCGNSFVGYREKQVEYKRKGYHAPVFCRDCGWKKKLEKMSKGQWPKKIEMSDREKFGY